MKFNAALDRLPTWTAAPGDDWPARATIDATGTMDEAQRAFERCAAGEPAVAFGEIYIQTGYDPSPAPEGKHLLSVFGQYAPYDLADGDWDACRDDVAKQFIDLISRFAPDLPDCLADHEVLGPPDIESRIGLTGGNIFQGEVTPDQMWEHRLTPRTPVPGLYLCGAATHPAGSVIALNGRNAAAAVLADAGAALPEPAAARRELGPVAATAKAEGTRERILESACDLIASDGIDDVRIARVATRAGVSTALVHHYFSTREELLEQALLHSFSLAADERFGEDASADADDAGAAAGLAHAIRTSLPEPGHPEREWVLWVELLAARGSRPGPAAGRGRALRPLPRLARGRDPRRGRERRVHATSTPRRPPTTRWRCSTGSASAPSSATRRWTSPARATRSPRSWARCSVWTPTQSDRFSEQRFSFRPL